MVKTQKSRSPEGASQQIIKIVTNKESQKS